MVHHARFEPGTYPGTPMQATHHHGPAPHGGYGFEQDGGQAASYYGSHPSTHRRGPGHGHGGMPAQDGHGADERGLGTMALGAAGGIAANKMNGSHHSNFKSGASGAFLAQGAKMAYGMFNKKQQQHHHQQGAGAGAGAGGFGHGHGHGYGHSHGYGKHQGGLSGLFSSHTPGHNHHSGPPSPAALGHYGGSHPPNEMKHHRHHGHLHGHGRKHGHHEHGHRGGLFA